MSKEVNYTEKEDFLEEDQEIPGQKFCLLSFLSPEKVLASKDSFLFSTFVKDYEIQYKTKKLEAFLADTVRSVNAKLEAEAVKAEKFTTSWWVRSVSGCRGTRIPMQSQSRSMPRTNSTRS